MSNIVQEYRSSKRINYSLLKSLFNPSWVYYCLNNAIPDEDKLHFRIGSALDILLTDPDEFNRTFMYFNGVRPTGMMLTFLDSLPILLNKSSEESLYREAYEKSGYKTPLSTIISNLWEKDVNRAYYEFRVESLGKTILTKDEMDEVLSLKRAFVSNPFLSKYFTYTPGIDIYYQVPIYFTYKDVQCKGLLDGILVDHNRKVIEIFDLKTTGKGINAFEGEMFKHSYFLQAVYYQIAVEQLRDKQATTALEIDLPDYPIENMKFLVASKAYNDSACVWALSDADKTFSIEGGKRYGKDIKGLNQLIDDFKWHVNTDKWTYSRDYYNNQGVFETNLFNSLNE